MTTPPPLLFGPYKPPRYKVGDTLTCAVRGPRIITGTSDAPIPWPTTTPRSPTLPRWPVLIVCGDLERALRVESRVAICFWFGVSASTAVRWRRALGVPAMTEGTVQRRLDCYRARQDDWSAEEDAMLGTASDPTIAAALGRERYEVCRRRHALGIPAYGSRPHGWTAAEDALLGTVPDAWIAARLGIVPSAVTKRRRKLGVKRNRGPGGRAPSASARQEWESEQKSGK